MSKSRSTWQARLHSRLGRRHSAHVIHSWGKTHYDKWCRSVYGSFYCRANQIMRFPWKWHCTRFLVLVKWIQSVPTPMYWSFIIWLKKKKLYKLTFFDIKNHAFDSPLSLFLRGPCIFSPCSPGCFLPLSRSCRWEKKDASRHTDMSVNGGLSVCISLVRDCWPVHSFLLQPTKHPYQPMK